MWNVLLVEPNREKAAATHLGMLGATTYFPVMAKAACFRSRGGRRWRVSLKALFPSYLFVIEQSDLFVLARIAVGVRRSQRSPFLLAHSGAPAVVEAAKVKEIQALEREINLTRSKHTKFRIGDRVLIRDGAFCGHRAVVHTLSDSARIELLLDFLGQKAKVSLGAEQIDAMAA